MTRGSFTQSDYRRMIQTCEQQTRHMTTLKPGRRLGASWIDEFVGNRRSVSLCRECERKYGDWHVHVNYHARDVAELTDCDGCGESLKVCKGYYASLI